MDNVLNCLILSDQLTFKVNQVSPLDHQCPRVPAQISSLPRLVINL